MYHRERREKGGNNKDIKELKQEKKIMEIIGEGWGYGHKII